MPDKYSSFADYALYIFSAAALISQEAIDYVDHHTGTIMAVVAVLTFYKNERRKNKLLQLRIEESRLERLKLERELNNNDNEQD